MVSCAHHEPLLFHLFSELARAVVASASTAAMSARMARTGTLHSLRTPAR